MADRERRLLYRAGARAGAGLLHPCRWVDALNGHPGRCGPDCWHATPEEASACFHGRLTTTMPTTAAPAITARRAT